MKYDAIIIGAGLGGLTAGAKLSKAGKKVLLVEQHNIPGGCATTYERKGFRFEVGLHEMDGLHPRDMKTKVFRDLGVFDKVEFLKVPEFYRFVYKDYDIVISHDVDMAKAELLKHFPNEEAGIESYFHHIVNAKLYLKENADKEAQNVGEFLDSIIQNDNLKLALLGNLGYFHDDPYTLSLGYYLMAQGSYYAGGGNFIKGGSQSLSDYLADYIEQNGGRVVLNHIVNEILVENDKAVGIAYMKKNSEKIIKDYGENIIANAAIPNVANKLLSSEIAYDLKKGIQEREIGASLLTIYFGFNIPIKNLGNTNYSVFLYDDSVASPKDILSNNQGDFAKRSFTFVDYSQVDSDLAPKGKSVGVACCLDYIKDWEDLTREAYKAKKKEVAQVFIEKLEQLIPGIKDAIEYYEVGTAKTVERYTMNPEGAVYGFAQTPERTKLESLKSIENLYFASAWTKIGGGFSGVIFNGYMCAIEILRKR